MKLRQRGRWRSVPGDLDLDHSVMKAHGGSVPMYVDGELIGTITMSGELDVIDHETVVEAVRRYQATAGLSAI